MARFGNSFNHQRSDQEFCDQFLVGTSRPGDESKKDYRDSEEQKRYSCSEPSIRRDAPPLERLCNRYKQNHRANQDRQCSEDLDGRFPPAIELEGAFDASPTAVWDHPANEYWRASVAEKYARPELKVTAMNVPDHRLCSPIAERRPFRRVDAFPKSALALRKLEIRA
jgi:hypothetical protein